MLKQLLLLPLFSLLSLQSYAGIDPIKYCPKAEDIRVKSFYRSPSYFLIGKNHEGKRFSSGPIAFAPRHAPLKPIGLVSQTSLYDDNSKKLTCTYMAIDRYVMTVKLTNQEAL